MNPSPRPNRILIADDEPSVFKTLSALLDGKNYDLHAASDGLETLTQIRSLKPDLVLLDVMMPGMNGIDVCKTIREDPELHETPIIILTAYHDRTTLVRALAAGADEFMAKPVVGVELRVRVATMLRLRHQALRFNALMNCRHEFQLAIDDLRMRVNSILAACESLQRSGGWSQEQQRDLECLRSDATHLNRSIEQMYLLLESEQDTLE